MASTGQLKRKAADLEMPRWENPLSANHFMMNVDHDPRLILTLFDSYETFCEWMWERRRELHLIGYITDDGGEAVGWTTIARMLVLSARIRREFNVPAGYSIITDDDYNKLARIGLLVCERRVCSYDLVDVRMTIRLLCVKWTAQTMWNQYGLLETMNLVEMLLYDINMRVEGMWVTTPSVTKPFVDLIQELAHATAVVHAMIGFARAQLLTRNRRFASRHEYFPSALVFSAGSKAEAYAAAVQRLGTEMESVFNQNVRLGTMKEDLCPSVQLLLSPVDTAMRARAKTGIAVPNAMTARRHGISVNEYIWDMTKMPDLTAEDFLNAASWDEDNAWLVRTICMFRVAHIMVTQYAQSLHWVAACVLFDRDAFRTIAANGFRTTPPLLYVTGHRVFLIHENDYYACETPAEAFFLWCCIIHGVYKDVLMTGKTAQYDLKKDLDGIFNICCPRRAEDEILDDGEDDDVQDLTDNARDLLEAFGLGIGPMRAAPAAVDPDRQAEIDALFDGDEDEPTTPEEDWPEEGYD